MNARLLIAVGLLVLGTVRLTCAAEGKQSRLTTSKEDAPIGHNPVRKLGRGCANLLFGIVEVPNQVTKARSEHGGAGLTYGVPKGFVRWVGRELVGVWEIVTFPLPLPKGYQPVMQPEWPNEEFEP